MHSVWQGREELDPVRQVILDAACAGDRSKTDHVFVTTLLAMAILLSTSTLMRSSGTGVSMARPVSSVSVQSLQCI